MKEQRKNDRRKKSANSKKDIRKGPRRLTCECGGKVEPVINKNNTDTFVCLRCGKKY